MNHNKQKSSQKVLTLFPILLICYEICFYLANDAYLPALPIMAKDFQVSHQLVQLTLTAMFLGNASIQVILGPLSDRFGRRLFLLSSGIVFIIASLVCALTLNIHFFLIARFMQGAAISAMVIAGYATIHALFDQTRAIKTIAWMSAIIVLAPALGPIFGALILLFASWRWIFIILATAVFLLMIGLFKITPETSEKTLSLHPANILKQYTAAICCWKFLQPLLIMSLLFAAMIAWITAGPFIIMDIFNYSPQKFALMQALVFGCFILGTRCTSSFIHRFPLNKITKIAIFIAAIASVFAIVLSYLFPNELKDLIIPMMFVAFGNGTAFPILNRQTMEASAVPLGIKVALLSFAMGMSGFLGSLLVSLFYDGTVLRFAVILLILCGGALVIKKINGQR